MTYIYTLLICMVLLCTITYFIYNRIRRREPFQAANTVAGDIPAFLKALADYNLLYSTLCVNTQTPDTRCSMYKPATSSGPYMPPTMPGAEKFANAAYAWNGTGTMPTLSAADFGTRIPSYETLDLTTEFIYYTKGPTDNTRFINNTKDNKALTSWEVWLNNLINVSVQTISAQEVIFTPYINVDGVNYKFTKMFQAPNTPADALVVRKKSKTGTVEIGVTYRGNPGYTYRFIQGTSLENNDRIFTMMLESTSQDEFDTSFDDFVAVPVSVSSSAKEEIVPVASSSVAPAKTGARVGEEKLELPALTYYEDAWFRNRTLFAKMYASVGQPTDEVKRYYQGAGAGAEGQTYELTALKFLELDRLVLKSVTANGVVNVAQLQGYALEVPYPYDPALYDILNTMEEPSQNPQGLKCYAFTEAQAKIIRYLSSRPYENLTTTNLELLAKFRANLCASYGYYSKDNLESCACEGCCIPVNYKTTYGRRATVGTSALIRAETEKVLGSGDTGGCIYTSRAYRLKRRQLPLGVDEGDTCIKEGFEEDLGDVFPNVTRTFTEDVGLAKATAGETKGWRLFAQRVVPAYLGGDKADEGFRGSDEGFRGSTTYSKSDLRSDEGFASLEGLLCPSLDLRTSEGFRGSTTYPKSDLRSDEGFRDGCLTPSLPSPYRLRRGKPRLMTCG